MGIPEVYNWQMKQKKKNVNIKFLKLQKEKKIP